MRQFWKSDACYEKDHGVNGSICSFIIYLSEVSVKLWEIMVLWKSVWLKTVLPRREKLKNGFLHVDFTFLIIISWEKIVEVIIEDKIFSGFVVLF